MAQDRGALWLNPVVLGALGGLLQVRLMLLEVPRERGFAVLMYSRGGIPASSAAVYAYHVLVAAALVVPASSAALYDYHVVAANAHPAWCKAKPDSSKNTRPKSKAG
jgi:hypothetical protein